ncbi:hypothetical protein I350_06324 [Cryptococcus amylolentus CBS 6273]|uniref:Uncharacterized protein n=1 Tax=Cryptococcus amylolentus CBS 6273 TaxID=1296118 RepID=A0A1E3JKV8_9TREE|nr:hypothetical protein I350_06324 [Cryptococcus amylolentus CBS 6273]
MHALKSQWHRLGSPKGKAPYNPDQGDEKRLVVGHFMLGNTYPFTADDWQATFDLAEDTLLDAIVLNIGPEHWQLTQAQLAYELASSRRIKLLLSLDVNVLPHSPDELSSRVVTTINAGRASQLLWDDKPVLSTFSGHEFGDDNWVETLRLISRGLEQQVMFWPAFFIPPSDFMAKLYVDGTFAWNSGWAMDNTSMNLKEDQPFLKGDKPYMAAISPLFFTHYGTEGDWAWNKNWIYPSDNLLLPNRFLNFISPHAHTPTPQIIQLISLNDYGESHYLFPVRGAQPGSSAWTEGMDHEGFRIMCKYFIGRWKNGMSEIEELEDGHEGKVVIWYRTKPKDGVYDDAVGRPDRAEWASLLSLHLLIGSLTITQAEDLINLFILLPSHSAHYTLHLTNGPADHTRSLKSGRLNLLTLPFIPGNVHYSITKKEGSAERVILEGDGKEITEGGAWNFNMWSGSVY